MTTIDCDICLSPCNKTTKKQCTCLFCNGNFCRACLQDCLLKDTSIEIRCPGCKAIWNRDVIDTLCTIVFRKGPFKAHREKMLLDVELARLPEDQDDAMRYQTAKKELAHLDIEYTKARKIYEESDLNKSISIINNAMNELWYRMKYDYPKELLIVHRANHPDIVFHECVDCGRSQRSFQSKLKTVHTYYREISNVNYDLLCKSPACIEYQNAKHAYDRPQIIIMSYGRETVRSETVKKVARTFLKGCPVADCRGFLSTQWKCGLCDTKVCKECHEPTNEEHLCDPDKVKSVALIEKETRPCPKCASLIYKVSGCDQMFCTECQTPFSWVTGQIETGHIHNPHYFEWARKNGTAIARAPAGNLVCGMDNNAIREALFARTHWRVLDSDEKKQNISLLGRYQLIEHMRHTIARRRRTIDDIFTEDSKRILRVQYLVKEITQEDWKKTLQEKEQALHRERSRYQLLEMYVNACNDIINTLLASTSLDVLTQLNTLLVFTMDQYESMNKRLQTTAELRGVIQLWSDPYWTAPEKVVKKKKEPIVVEEAEDSD